MLGSGLMPTRPHRPGECQLVTASVCSLALVAPLMFCFCLVTVGLDSYLCTTFLGLWDEVLPPEGDLFWESEIHVWQTKLDYEAQKPAFAKHLLSANSCTSQSTAVAAHHQVTTGLSTHFCVPCSGGSDHACQCWGTQMSQRLWPVFFFLNYRW